MSDSVRVNKYRAYYTGPPRSDPHLRLKSLNDRTAMAYVRTHPSVHHVANVQSSNPQNYQLMHPRHQQPLHIFPELRGATRHIRGSAKYNQAIQQRIAELAKLVQ